MATKYEEIVWLASMGAHMHNVRYNNIINSRNQSSPHTCHVPDHGLRSTVGPHISASQDHVEYNFGRWKPTESTIIYLYIYTYMYDNEKKAELFDC